MMLIMICLLQVLSSSAEACINQKCPGYLQNGVCYWRLSDFSRVVRMLDTAPEEQGIDVLGKGNVQVR